MGDGYLVLCSYCIAVLDLASALLFAIVSGLVYAKHGHWTSLAALVFTIFWMCIILMLLMGIYWRNLNLLRYWLIFTCLGIFLDGIILIYGLTMAISVNWEGIKITLLPFIGLAVEMTFVYIIYIFYLVTDQRYQIDRNIGGEERSLSEPENNDKEEEEEEEEEEEKVYPNKDENIKKKEQMKKKLKEHYKQKRLKKLTEDLQYNQSKDFI